MVCVARDHWLQCRLVLIAIKDGVASDNKGRKIRTYFALSLHQEAGAPLAKCGVEEIKRFQAVMKEYQIHVFSKYLFSSFVYEGSDAVINIYLLLHDEHYDVITTMSGFFNKKYFCDQCKEWI